VLGSNINTLNIRLLGGTMRLTTLHRGVLGGTLRLITLHRCVLIVDIRCLKLIRALTKGVQGNGITAGADALDILFLGLERYELNVCLMYIKQWALDPSVCMASGTRLLH
jgi:hypothetical protein